MVYTAIVALIGIAVGRVSLLRGAIVHKHTSNSAIDILTTDDAILNGLAGLNSYRKVYGIMYVIAACLVILLSTFLAPFLGQILISAFSGLVAIGADLYEDRVDTGSARIAGLINAIKSFSWFMGGLGSLGIFIEVVITLNSAKTDRSVVLGVWMSAIVTSAIVFLFFVPHASEIVPQNEEELT